MHQVFDLHSNDAYQRWRDAKLGGYPNHIEEIIVEISDPYRPTEAEWAKVADCIRRANMAIYACRNQDIADREIPRAFGLAFGLERLDRHLMADGDGLSSLTVADVERKGEFIPYTDRPIRWHTDGYYNPPERTIRALQLYCIEQAASGGENRLLDHEVVYIALRDEDPGHIRALMAADAMTIPARSDENGVARPDQSGPVFSIQADGSLHMRYTARTRSIAWKNDTATRAALGALERILDHPSPHLFTARLEPGMGLMCNNILHDRSGFADDENHKRLILRGRYYDRIGV